MQEVTKYLQEHNRCYAIVFDSPTSKKWDCIKADIKDILSIVGAFSVALFGPDLASAKRLYSVLLEVKGWKSASFYHKDKSLALAQIFPIAECIAHKKYSDCLGYIRHEPEGYTWFITPCKAMKIQPGYDSEFSYLDIYRDNANESGFSLCPYYHPNVLCGPFDCKGKIKKPSLIKRLVGLIKK